MTFIVGLLALLCGQTTALMMVPTDPCAFCQEECILIQPWCIQAPCPPIATCAYNCNTREIWSPEKRNWCCENEGQGCLVEEECVNCIMMMPMCEFGCQNCLTTPQTCHSCAAATCMDAINCAVVSCLSPESLGCSPEVAFTPPGECCPQCPLPGPGTDCSTVRCASPESMGCSDDEAFRLPGQCCFQCPEKECINCIQSVPTCDRTCELCQIQPQTCDSCAAAICMDPKEEERECVNCIQSIPTCDRDCETCLVQPQTCRSCASATCLDREGIDCALVRCASPESQGCSAELAFTPPGGCCAICPSLPGPDCATVLCVSPDSLGCSPNEAFTPPGECCPRCPPKDRDCQAVTLTRRICLKQKKLGFGLNHVGDCEMFKGCPGQEASAGVLHRNMGECHRITAKCSRRTP